MIDPIALLGLPGYEITGIEEIAGVLRIALRHTGVVSCPDCGGTELRNRDRRWRRLRHDSFGLRHCVLELETRKWRCKGCGRTFWQRASPARPWSVGSWTS